MRRGFAFLSILLLLAVLIACNSNPGNRELIVCIDNAVAGKGAKTIAYDGSLTDGNTDINAYRILVSGGDMSLDTGWQMTDEFLLADVLSGTYSFTVQGAVASDDLSAVYPVAEDLYEIAVDGNPVFLELKSIIPGLCPYIELRFYLPYGFHENDVVDFGYLGADGCDVDGSGDKDLSHLGESGLGSVLERDGSVYDESRLEVLGNRASCGLEIHLSVLTDHEGSVDVDIGQCRDDE